MPQTEGNGRGEAGTGCNMPWGTRENVEPLGGPWLDSCQFMRKRGERFSQRWRLIALGDRDDIEGPSARTEGSSPRKEGLHSGDSSLSLGRSSFYVFQTSKKGRGE